MLPVEEIFFTTEDTENTEKDLNMGKTVHHSGHRARGVMSRNPAAFVIANRCLSEAISVPVKTVKADSLQGTQGYTGKIQSRLKAWFH
jgi:hypothetical protein